MWRELVPALVAIRRPKELVNESLVNAQLLPLTRRECLIAYSRFLGLLHCRDVCEVTGKKLHSLKDPGTAMSAQKIKRGDARANADVPRRVVSFDGGDLIEQGAAQPCCAAAHMSSSKEGNTLLALES
jgi:hypothetical protein